MEDDSVIGDWIKEQVLGSGSFGTVSLWHNLKTAECLAIKICKWGNEAFLTAKHKERWTKEVEMMKSIENDNIVGTKTLPEDLAKGLIPSNVSKLPMLCMEFCSKGDLRQLLNHPDNGNGLPEIEVRSILTDLKNAVSYLHDLKITHRDLKPENIVLQVNTGLDIAPHNRTTIYKLVDLGYAKEIDSQSQCASFVGTLQYLAPELLYSKTYSNTVDYWSLGLVAFEIICGIRPFLPNLAPVQWMNHVKTKSPDDICVFENCNGDIEFSKFLFNENYISNCFKGLIEKWLRVALDWDPKRRGRSTEEKCVKFTLPEGDKHDPVPPLPARDAPLVIFTLLKSTLLKKVLVIFSAITCEYLSYEIDDNTLLSTVRSWVGQDVAVAAEHILFISPKAEKAMDSAVDYWNPGFLIMLYAFRQDSLFTEDKSPKPNIPSKLSHCLGNPKIKFKYNILSEISSCGLYFIKKERRLYESLVIAFQLIIEHLFQKIKKLHINHNDSDKCMCRLNEKTELLLSILKINNEQATGFEKSNRLLDYVSKLKLWSDKSKSLLDKIYKLREAWAQLTARLQSASRRCNEVHHLDVSTRLHTTDYAELQKEATKQHVHVKNIPKENRSNLSSCAAVKLVYKCLKVRDNLLNNQDMRKISRQIIDIHVETSKMTQLLINVGQNAKDLSDELTRLFIEKEESTFSLLDSLHISNNCLLNNSPPDTPREELPPQSVVNFKIGAAVSSSRGRRLSTNNVDELQSLIKDNVSLRARSKISLQKSYENHKNILDQMDFSYLE